MHNIMHGCQDKPQAPCRADAGSKSGLRWDLSPRAFWLILIVLAVVRLITVSDLNVPIIYGPHDGLLYVSRAFHLLLGHGFGPYNSQLLIKHPGISIWIYLVRLTGVSFFLSVNLVFILAGMYFVQAARRAGGNSILLFACYVAYLFNPVSYFGLFLQVLRDGVAPPLMVLLLGALIFIFHAARSERPAVSHLLVFTVTFSFLLQFREEDFLLYVLWAAFAGLLFWSLRPVSWHSPPARILLAVLILPLLSSGCGDLATRWFIRAHYGAGPINDFGSGEFAGLIAAMRSVKSEAKSRYISIPQDSVRKIGKALPELSGFLSQLPPPPAQDPYYFGRWGVRGEWPNSHFFFWIKDTAYRAGLTPDLPAAQQFFRRTAQDIRRACRDGRLACEPDGDGLFPAFHLTWLPVMGQEAIGVAGMMVYPPREGFLLSGPPIASPWGGQNLEASDEVGRQYQLAVMSPYDGGLQAAFLGSNVPAGWSKNVELYANLKYWLDYPDVAASPAVGVQRCLGPEFNRLLQRTAAGLIPGRSASFSAATAADYMSSLQRAGLISQPEWERWQNAPADVYFVLRYLMQQPEEAIRLLQTRAQGQELGAIQHYRSSGASEGRTWFSVSPQVTLFRSPLASWRDHVWWIRGLSSLMIILGVLALLLRLALERKISSDAIGAVAAAFLFYSMVQIAALAYVSVPLGHVDARLCYPNYFALLLFGPLLVADAARAFARRVVAARQVKKQEPSV
jgi:hypothetical protein